MARPFRLQLVLDLALQRVDVATTELQRLRTHWNEAQSKLDELRAYATEYSAGLGTRLAQGMPVHQLNDYRLFQGKLARAIQAQGEEVDRRHRSWDEAHALWLGLRQRHKALEVLAQRHAAAELLVETRREQKEQDEFALKAVKETAFRR